MLSVLVLAEIVATVQVEGLTDATLAATDEAAWLVAKVGDEGERRTDLDLLLFM